MNRGVGEWGALHFTVWLAVRPPPDSSRSTAGGCRSRTSKCAFAPPAHCSCKQSTLRSATSELEYRASSAASRIFRGSSAQAQVTAEMRCNVARIGIGCVDRVTSPGSEQPAQIIHRSQNKRRIMRRRSIRKKEEHILSGRQLTSCCHRRDLLEATVAFSLVYL